MLLEFILLLKYVVCVNIKFTGFLVSTTNSTTQRIHTHTRKDSRGDIGIIGLNKFEKFIDSLISQVIYREKGTSLFN